MGTTFLANMALRQHLRTLALKARNAPDSHHRMEEDSRPKQYGDEP